MKLDLVWYKNSPLNLIIKRALQLAAFGVKGFEAELFDVQIELSEDLNDFRRMLLAGIGQPQKGLAA